MRRLVALLLTATLTAACLGSDFADSLEGTWQLTSGTVEGTPVPIIDTHPITITFEGDQVGGTAACNSYGGSYELSGGSITFGNLAMTEMACSPDEVMEAESLYATGLTEVTSVTVDGDLTLKGPGVELVFTHLEPVPDTELTGTVWVLDGLIAGDAISSVSGDRATIEFFTDGSVLGGTGCWVLSGHYTINGAELQMTDLSADGPECDPDLVAQDGHVIAALEGPMRVEIDGGRLTLTSPGGDGVTYQAEA